MLSILTSSQRKRKLERRNIVLKGDSIESFYEEARSEDLEDTLKRDPKPPLDDVECCSLITIVATLGELIL